jgi:hypothetical protein
MLELQRASRQATRMKIKSSLRFVLAAVALAALGACATYPKTGQAALVGTWTNSFGTVWMIKADGTFDVDLRHQGKRDAWGTYAVSGDTVTLQRTGGMNPKGCKGPGVYEFSRTDEKTLSFTLVKDACQLRKKNVLEVWHQK